MTVLPLYCPAVKNTASKTAGSASSAPASLTSKRKGIRGRLAGLRMKRVKLHLYHSLARCIIWQLSNAQLWILCKWVLRWREENPAGMMRSTDFPDFWAAAHRRPQNYLALLKTFKIICTVLRKSWICPDKLLHWENPLTISLKKGF